MLKIKEIATKPSEALQFMVDGLLEYDQNPLFQINMSTFGEVKHGICCGCAATCTIQKMANKQFDADHVFNFDKRAIFLKIQRESLDEFESAIDYARQGDLVNLFFYYDIPANGSNEEFTSVLGADGCLIHMATENWRNQIPYVIEHIEKLKAAGY